MLIVFFTELNMKKIKYVFLVVATSLSLSVNSSPISKPTDRSILCDLFGLNCPIVVQDGNGDGAEPPKDS